MFRSGEELEGEIPDQKMILGDEKKNPFTKAIIGEAYKEVYGFKPSNLPTTDLYVRFAPADLEELKTLLEIEDLTLFQHPLHYHIVQEGSYYKDPSLAEDAIPWQYAVVKPNFNFPNVQFKVLEELVLVPQRSYVAAKAFELTDNPHFMLGGSGDDVTSADPLGDPCIPSCPNYPACLDDPYIGCEQIITPPTGGGGGGGGTNDPPCDVDSPDWPDCLMVAIEPGTSVFGDPTTTDCGCIVSANPRIPGGCVQLNDTQLGIEGVRNVAIEWYNGWFTVHKTSTDENGCWRLNNHVERGKAKLTIKYKNNRRVIRAMQGTKVWQYAFAVKSEHSYGGPPYNDSNVIFNTNDDDDSGAKKRWYAATANNSLYEYDDFASADGILPPPNRCDILLVNAAGPAAAPMLDEMLKNPIINIGSNIAVGAIAISSAQFIELFLPGVGGALAITASVIWQYVKLYAPDVIYSYGDEFAAFHSSDRVKNTFYHEYAHATHYAGLNNDFYWLGNVATIASNGGNGDGTDANSERIAISEAWAAMIGDVYADRRFGVEHNLTASTDPEFINRTRHIFRHEQFNPFNPEEPHFSTEPWIPEGIFLDCIDDNFTDNPAGVNEPAVIVDDLSGYTIANCFDAVSNEPQSVADVEADLTAILPPTNVLSSITGLFASYGY